MSLKARVYIALFAVIIVSCNGVPHRVDGGRVVASVGSRALRLGEVKASIPAGMTGGDSLDFVSLYIDRWVARQIKISEAERIFSSSVGDIEAMVSEYRQSLLTHKLDQHYIKESKEVPFEQTDIRLFYNRNSDLFRLNESIVKGTIIKIPNSYEDIKSLETMMRKSDQESRLNLLSMCDRIDGAQVEDLYVQWVDYDDFISRLPIVWGEGSDIYMKRRGVQILSDGYYTYFFEIVAYRSAGYTAPLEMVQQEVERILTTQYHQELIRQHDEKLYNVEKRSGEIKIYLKEGELSGEL